MLLFENPAFQHRLFFETNAWTVNAKNSTTEGGQMFCCLPLHPLSVPPLHLSPTPDLLVWSICLSWEEVPSHLTLRKWFQCMLVWILAGFCNCQFPYQSVCISIGKTWATSPLPLSSFVLVECSCCCRWWRLLTGLLDSAIGWVCVCVRNKCLCCKQI